MARAPGRSRLLCRALVVLASHVQSKGAIRHVRILCMPSDPSTLSGNTESMYYNALSVVWSKKIVGVVNKIAHWVQCLGGRSPQKPRRR